MEGHLALQRYRCNKSVMVFDVLHSVGARILTISVLSLVPSSILYQTWQKVLLTPLVLLLGTRGTNIGKDTDLVPEQELSILVVLNSIFYQT